MAKTKETEQLLTSVGNLFPNNIKSISISWIKYDSLYAGSSTQEFLPEVNIIFKDNGGFDSNEETRI